MPLDLIPGISGISDFLIKQKMMQRQLLQDEASRTLGSLISQGLSQAKDTQGLTDTAMKGYNAALYSGNKDLIPVIDRALQIKGGQLKDQEELQASQAVSDLWLRQFGSSMFKDENGVMTNGATYFNKAKGLYSDPKLLMRVLDKVKPLEKSNSYYYDEKSKKHYMNTGYLDPFTGQTVGSAERNELTPEFLKTVTDQRVLDRYQSQKEFLERIRVSQADDNKPKLYGEVMYPGEDGTMQRGVATAKLVGNEFRIFVGGKDITDVAYKAPTVKDAFKSQSAFESYQTKLQTDYYNNAAEFVTELGMNGDQYGLDDVKKKITESGFSSNGKNALGLFSGAWSMKGGIQERINKLLASDNEDERKQGEYLRDKAYKIWNKYNEITYANNMNYNIQNGYQNPDGSWTEKGLKYLQDAKNKNNNQQNDNTVETNPETGKKKVKGS